MSRRAWVRGLVASAALAGAAAILPVAAAGSAVSQDVSFDPATGGAQDYTTLTTSGPCPDPATHMEVLVSGGSVDPLHEARAVGVTSISALSRSGSGLVVPLTLSMRELAESVGAHDARGSYQYVVRCRTSDDPTSLADFSGTLEWAGGTSQAFTSTYSVARPGPPAWRPVVAGEVRSGGTAACVADFDGAVSVAYTWLLDGAPVAGQSARSVAIPESWYGRRLACAVTATAFDGAGTAGTSAPVGVALGVPLHPASAPALTGTARVGHRLSVRPPAWSPAARRQRYQWRRDGRAVPSATGTSYLLSAADAGHRVSAVVVAARQGWRDGTAGTRAVLVAR